MDKILVILGSTATGKTDLALRLAKKFNGELVACDSRQVYTGLDIGTGKYPSKISNFEFRISNLKKQNGRWIINGINVWMYDVVSPKRQYTVADYVKDVSKVTSNIVTSKKLPIIVGGTGLYLKALLEGLPNLAIPVDRKLRKELEKLTLGELQEKLKSISFDRWKKLNTSDRQNPRRLIRAIELKTSPRRSSFDFAQDHLRGVSSFSDNDVLKIGLTAPREILYKGVDLRVLSRVKQGMIDEARNLHEGGLSLKRMRQLGLEYGVLADYLDGRIKSEEELIKIMQGQIHGYVRRQLTWFKKEEHVTWIDIIAKNWAEKVEKLVVRWYHT